MKDKEYMDLLQIFIDIACDAQDMCDLDELEEYTNEQRQKENKK